MEAFMGVWRFNSSTISGDADPMLNAVILPGVTPEDLQQGGEIEMTAEGKTLTIITRPPGRVEIVDVLVLGEKDVRDGPGGVKVETVGNWETDRFVSTSHIGDVTVRTVRYLRNGDMINETSSGGKTVTARLIR
ncbi:uncharacterized protein LOC101860866 [Aplysia californica]|uniref:Uncharacterized protein LOC101860866 n=1 Tax=Aplysia californica TaxID=6500 RepID=A0ABM1W3N9_APLCA|nr:uncharacterized protein LOC101860866 [Aplysia californica]